MNLAGIGRRFKALNGFRTKVFFARVNNIIEEPDAIVSQVLDQQGGRGRAGPRGDGRRRRAARPGGQRLQRHRGHPWPVSQRLPHEAARRGGRARRFGLTHAEGRDQRGDSRLGDERAQHLLPARQRRGAAPVPGEGARLPVRDRPRGARAAARGGGAAAHGRHRLRRRRLERDGALPPLPRRPGAAGGRGGGRRGPRREARRHADDGPARRAARHAILPAPGRGGAGRGGTFYPARHGLPGRGSGGDGLWYA